MPWNQSIYLLQNAVHSFSVLTKKFRYIKTLKSLLLIKYKMIFLNNEFKNYGQVICTAKSINT